MVTLTSMTSDECWQLLGSRGVGRIGFDRGRGPRIHPVDYTVHDRTVYVRTEAGTELGDFVAMFGNGALVSFEVDQLSGDVGERWSVLVAARTDMPGQDEVGGLRPDREPSPTPAGARTVLVRLKPVEVTGRRLVEPATPETTGQASPPTVPGPGSRRLTDYWLG
jgi:hypothetical protein